DLSLAPPETTIHLLGSLLERMTNANDQLGQLRQDHSLSHSPSAHTRFHARSIPSIALSPYLFRILKYCPCTNECFLAVLVYFDRMAKHSLATNGQPFSIDSYNIHRLIITGVMIATKFFSDIFYTNARYAKVGGIALSELNRLEVEFLTLNSFNMSVSVSELQRYGDSLLN
ncbi:cyclin PHO80-like protein, partial [Phycomyces nitens]